MKSFKFPCLVGETFETSTLIPNSESPLNPELFKMSTLFTGPHYYNIPCILTNRWQLAEALKFGYGQSEQGPYFTGINRVLPIPQVTINLYSPTSTSVDIEVSMIFATRNGMILQLNRIGHIAADCLTCFDCSWFSRYPDENERLFCGGRIKICVFYSHY